jgi:hypothetical protein
MRQRCSAVSGGARYRKACLRPRVACPSTEFSPLLRTGRLAANRPLSFRTVSYTHQLAL